MSHIDKSCRLYLGVGHTAGPICDTGLECEVGKARIEGNGGGGGVGGGGQHY